MENPPQLVVDAPQKRSLEDDVDPHVSTPDKAAPSNSSTPLSTLSTMASPSPMKLEVRIEPSLGSVSGSSSNNSVAGDAPVSNLCATASSSTQPPAKRRKLTVREQEEKRLEKEAKEKVKLEKKAQKDVEDRLRAEQKAQKDEEKRVKDEERRKKNEEKEEKKRVKEFEQQRKDEEKRKKEEEKLKKERSQPTLSAFFSKPKPGAYSSGNATVDSNQNPITSKPSLSAPEVSLPETNSVPASPQKLPLRNDKVSNDWDSTFFPYNLSAHTILAPYNQFMVDPVKMATASSRLEELISNPQVKREPIELSSFKSLFPKSGPRGLRTVPIVDIVKLVNGSCDKPIDLTSNGPVSTPEDALDLLKEVPMKYIHFARDVRPPYYGTYTKAYSRSEESKMARNPFSRIRQDTHYDYDSEAEWEEPEEGEDLDSEGDDDMDEDEEDDMDGFLDDEEDPQLKRRHISGDLQPISTGLCWEDARGVSRLNDGSGAISTEFGEFTMGFLLEPQPQSIDPFSTAYWTPEPSPMAKTLAGPKRETVSKGHMKPPQASPAQRNPLGQHVGSGMLNTLNGAGAKTSGPLCKAAKPPKRQIPSEQLAAFKAEVQGSDLTKLALVESLKKKFPKVPKDAITNTLNAVATRVGAKEVDKRWVLH
ncbi:hypothetical protein K504DRAFT_451971 [Pleomassaria siparia CBS 279.74]|uniref:Chromatin assembly factor 1 subunit A n=1 Tax=Pleomassaria siparia CBS 279.74 TaxID=1314801 RepID=A0A6G1JR24_9PLEO|nr:hypothetical protein K504DRAFT_451971 [Pleomassaria siparia CBS 279.74]